MTDLATLAALFTAPEKELVAQGGRAGLSRDAAIALLGERADAAGLDVGRVTLRRAVDMLRGNPEASVPTAKRESMERTAMERGEGERRDFKIRGDTATCEVLTSNLVRTEADALAASEVDLDLWEPYQLDFGAWGSPVKLSSYSGGKKTGDTAKTVQLYRVAIKFRRKVYEPVLRDLAASLIEDLRAAAPSAKAAPPTAPDGVLYVVHVPDLHIDKVPVEGEWDAVGAHRKAVRTLLARARGLDIAEIVLPIGNDALNTDGGRRTTTAGTPQDGLGRWQQSFRDAVAMYRDAVAQCLEVAPVRIVVVSGNHDAESAWHIGAVLEAVYEGAESVTVDNGIDPRKYVSWKGNLIGLTHGDGCALKELPLLMATEAAEAWGAADGAREWLTGHKHSRLIESFGPVTVRIAPSLCPTDTWHKAKGYVGSPRQAEAYAYAPHEGRIAEFVYSHR